MPAAAKARHIPQPRRWTPVVPLLCTSYPALPPTAPCCHISPTRVPQARTQTPPSPWSPPSRTTRPPSPCSGPWAAAAPGLWHPLPCKWQRQRLTDGDGSPGEGGRAWTRSTCQAWERSLKHRPSDTRRSLFDEGRAWGPRRRIRVPCTHTPTCVRACAFGCAMPVCWRSCNPRSSARTVAVLQLLSRDVDLKHAAGRRGP